MFSVEAVDLKYKFSKICHSEIVFWRNVYDIKNVTFGIKFCHSNFNKFAQVSLFLSNSLYLYYKIIKQARYGLVQPIEMNTVVNR